MEKKSAKHSGILAAYRPTVLALATVFLGLSARAEMGAAGPQPAGPQPEAAPIGAQLEIREYRFQAYPRNGYERLVLEFTRKDMDASLQPAIKVSRVAGTRDVDIEVGKAILMGAIPESLINDSYVKKSRWLGPLSVNTDNPSNGFTLRASLKNPHAKIRALWLANRPRLVIDAVFDKTAPSPKRLAIEREHEGVAPFDHFICFPANASVGMNVIFQPRDRHDEELKNVHVNLQGLTSDDSAAPPPDAIVCYPRNAQVTASLAFETTVSSPQNEARASSHGSGGKGTTVVDDSDMTLEPPAAGMTAQREAPVAARPADPRGVAGTSQPAPTPAAAVPLLSVPSPMLNPPSAEAHPQPLPAQANAPAASPASLLPPLK